MLKSISQLVTESQDPTIVDLTSSKPTYICDDCMNGHHEVIGNSTCQCACHNNPTCFVCGDVLTLEWDIKVREAHESCFEAWEQQEDYKRGHYGK